MSTDDASSVVLIHPDDTVNTIMLKVRGSGSSQVQLLVPEGNTELQSPASCETLRRSLEADHIGLTIISADEKTLQAASQSHVDTIAVQGAAISIPDDSPTQPGSALAPPAAHPMQDEVPDDYDDFAAELDSLSDTMSETSALPDDYDPFAAELDSLSDTFSGQTPEGYDDFAAELDDLGDTLSGQTPSRSAQPSPAVSGSDEFDPFAELDDLGATMQSSSQPPDKSAARAKPAAAAPQPRRRIRPEDIVLSDDEKDRAASVRPGGGRRADSSDDKPKKKKSSGGIGIPSLKELRQQASAGVPSGGTSEKSDVPIPLPYLAAVIVIPMIVVIIAILWFGRTTVLVAPPVIQTEEIAFADYVVPIGQAGTEGAPLIIQAQRIESVVTSTEAGSVSGAVEAPATSAQGPVVLLNTGFQAVTLPQGTEFIATNPQGQEVRFTSDAELTIPAASTVQQGRQIITTLGEAQVTITARSPGSNSNIAENTITHIAIPGQEPFSVQAGAITIEHGAIGGGSEQTMHVVKDDDVHPVLELALTKLNNQARQQLKAQAEQQGINLETTTIWPTTLYLSSGAGYESTVVPEVGQPVADPNNPSFSVTVQANYNALATPPEAPLSQQLDMVLPDLFQQTGMITPGLGLKPAVSDWRWDGEKLVVDGVLQSTISGNDIDGQTRAMVRNAIQGKSRGEAEAALEQLRQQGLIGAYQLPANKTAIPTWDFLLSLKVVSPQQ